jgi:hypothetical protein
MQKDYLPRAGGINLPSVLETYRNMAKRGADVTPEFLKWLESIQPVNGVGANEAWNAGATWATREAQKHMNVNPQTASGKRAMTKAWEFFARQYDLHGNEWLDMGSDQYFAAGWKAAMNAPRPLPKDLQEHELRLRDALTAKLGANHPTLEDLAALVAAARNGMDQPQASTSKTPSP